MNESVWGIGGVILTRQKTK